MQKHVVFSIVCTRPSQKYSQPEPCDDAFAANAAKVVARILVSVQFL